MHPSARLLIYAMWPPEAQEFDTPVLDLKGIAIKVLSDFNKSQDYSTEYKQTKKSA